MTDILNNKIYIKIYDRYLMIYILNNITYDKYYMIYILNKKVMINISWLSSIINIL